MRNQHLLILIFVLVITRGVLFVSYPMGGIDDDQSAQRFLIDELVDGNWRIGNLRYNTGYPFFIAPIVWIAQQFGRLDDRIVLLLQIILSATIPLLVYDIIRIRRSSRAGFIVALVLILDPFGAQWAHWVAPQWLVAWCLVVALWLVHKAQAEANSRYVVWIAAAGVVLGVATVARAEAAIMAVLLGASLLFLHAFTWQRRLVMFGVLGVVSAGILTAYLATVQRESTGSMRPTCMTGINLLFSANTKDIALTANNGPHTEHLLELLALEPTKDIVFSAGDYPKWSESGPWATPAEQEAFFNQGDVTPKAQVDVGFPGDLIYYYGLCATDRLAVRAVRESVNSSVTRESLKIPT